MLKATNVTLDLVNDLAYVYYDDEEHPVMGYSRRLGDAIGVDFLENGNLYGIELLSLDEDTIAAAAGYANSIGAAFPSGLGQVVPC